MICFSCACGHVVELSNLMAGRSGICIRCRTPFVVPQESTLTEGVESPSDGEPARPVWAFHLPVTGLSGLALVVAFFLPWLNIQCAGVRLSAPSGLDLALDRPDSALRKVAQGPAKEIERETGKPVPQGLSITPDESPWGGTTPELFLFPFLGVAFAGFGLLGMLDTRSDLRPGTKVVLLLALLGLAALIAEKSFDYRKSNLADARARLELARGPAAGSGEVPPGIFSVEAAAGYYAAFASLCAVVVFHGIWLSMRPSSAWAPLQRNPRHP